MFGISNSKANMNGPIQKGKKDLAYCKILLYGTAYGYILTKWVKNNINFL